MFAVGEHGSALPGVFECIIFILAMRYVFIRLLKFFLLLLLGLGLILLASTLQHVRAPQAGEYHYSSFLRHNYTWLTIGLFFIGGLAIGYRFHPNPWRVGIAMIFIFPLVSMYEAAIYRGSHNLIPFELIVYFAFSLPAVAGVYLGNWVFQRRKDRSGLGEQAKSSNP